MSDLQPTIKSISPVAPILITLDPNTQTGVSKKLKLKYSVKDNTWQNGQAPVDFTASLEATNTPYHIVGGTPKATMSGRLTKKADDYTFEFVLEITEPIDGTAFPVSLNLSVYDNADPVTAEKSDAHSYSVTLQ